MVLVKTTLRILEGNKTLHKILRKTIKPELTDEVPFDQLIDLTSVVNFKDKMVDEAILHMKINQQVLDYLDQQLSVIENASWQKKQKLIFTDYANIKDKVDWQIYIDIFTRNNILNMLEGRLKNIQTIAERTEETPEETEKRKGLDSAK